MPVFGRLLVLLGVLLLLAAGPVLAAVDDLNDKLDGLSWREVGPYRGGRSAAVAGIAGDQDTYYFGAAGGGVWKTEDAGQHWDNVSDGFFGGSIGAVAVSQWDPNVIYVGTGEKTVRGNVSHGDGIWKSTDAGRTWKHMGLGDSRHIPRVRIHPRDPNRVYVAALGHLFGPNEERGVFRSTDGGVSWEKILFVNDEVGAVDLILDPTNPRILYATTWRILRTPYSLESGGIGSGLWKSTDGGDSWVSLNDKPGLPKAPLGIAGITVSPSNPDNLYAIIEAAEGGVFRSSDGGDNWQRTNKERKLRQRAWYYSRIYADPVDEDQVYVLNVRFHRSKDGGKTFNAIETPHGDNHDLWIAPENPKRMVQSNDGGANISSDGGETWSAQNNQPTAQMYRVSTDNAFPYRLLGGQQDNSAVRTRSRSAFGPAIGVRDWEPTAGGESGHVVARPDQPDIVYGGSYGGFLIRADHRSGDIRAVNIWPDNPMGWGAAQLKYRFNWNFPLMFSPHDVNTLYAAANVLFKTTDEGQTWQPISPDLTRNIKGKQGSSGGPITQDNTSVEYYGTLFAVAESLFEPGVIWAGSDDGLLHVTRDGGAEWEDVTPKGMPEEIQINSIEAHPFVAGGLYVAATAYKSDNFRPYLFKTENYGRSWQKITDGIDHQHFTRVIRADARQAGLLFAGTERGLYVSADDGENWQSLQLDLPLVPITDMVVKANDLIVATQGRGYWVLDDLGVLRQINDKSFDEAMRFFQPAPAYRLRNSRRDDPGHMGQNPPVGVNFRYWLATEPTPDIDLKLEIYDANGELIRRFSRKPADEDQAALDKNMGDDDRVLEATAGINEFAWNLRYPSAEKFPGMVLWNSDLSGPKAVPGDYRAVLTLSGSDNEAVSDADDDKQDQGNGELILQRREVAFSVVSDPRLDISMADYQAQFDFVKSIRDQLTTTHQAIRRIRAAKEQLERVEKQIGGDGQYEALKLSSTALKKTLSEVEEALYQTKMESRQDPLNFPIRLNDKLAGVKALAGFGDHAPTASMIAVRDDLNAQIDAQLGRLDETLEQDIKNFNQQAAELSLPAIAAPRLD